MELFEMCLPSPLPLCFGLFLVMGLCGGEGTEGGLPALPHVALVWGIRMCEVHVQAEQALLLELSDQRHRTQAHLKWMLLK